VLFRIIYCSHSRIEGSEQQITAGIESILQDSRTNNEEQDITGALFFDGRSFAQVLEGPRSSLDAVYAKICQDHRHTDVLLLEDDRIVERDFWNWTMAYIDADSILPEFGRLRFDQSHRNSVGFAAEIVALLKTAVDTYSSAIS
jgi:hypothetical protein